MTEARDAPRPRDYTREDELRERYRELLEELRTILPGVQVLFAFLLTAPFSARFGDLDEFGRDLYSVALIGTTLAMVVFLTPAAYHRIAPRQERDQRVRTGVTLMITGMGVLGVSVLVAVFTVLRFIFDARTGMAVAVPGAAIVLALWLVMPWMRRRGFQASRSR